MEHEQPMIAFSDATMRFGRKTPLGDGRKTVLDQVNLDVRSEEHTSELQSL